ncbi:hypothetical protein [Enterocloster sp.]|uniref:hypothetical protein n=1 Tax=Enterocloster sp. TaxID=2719315 RepID=UPI00399FEFE2
MRPGRQGTERRNTKPYESALRLYKFINDDISVLNGRQFKNNSASYKTLQSALRYLEIISLGTPAS